MLESNSGSCLDILLVNFYIYNIQEFLKPYIENKIVVKNWLKNIKMLKKFYYLKFNFFFKVIIKAIR